MAERAERLLMMVAAQAAVRFPEAYCTGVLAELDVRTGRLRYLSAGHPGPARDRLTGNPTRSNR